MSNNTENIELVCIGAILGSLLVVVLLGIATDRWRKRRVNKKRLLASKEEEEGEQDDCEKLTWSMDAPSCRDAELRGERSPRTLGVHHPVQPTMASAAAQPHVRQQENAPPERGRAVSAEPTAPTPIWSTSKHLPFLPVNAQINNMILQDRPLPPLPSAAPVLQEREWLSGKAPPCSVATAARHQPASGTMTDNLSGISLPQPAPASNDRQLVQPMLQSSAVHTPTTSAFGSSPIISAGIQSSARRSPRLTEERTVPYRQDLSPHRMHSPVLTYAPSVIPPRTSSITAAPIHERRSAMQSHQMSSPLTPYTPGLTFSSSPPSSWTMPRPLPRLPPLSPQPITPSTSRTPVREDDIFFLPLQSPSPTHSISAHDLAVSKPSGLNGPIDAQLWQTKPVPPIPLMTRPGHMTPASGSRPMDIDGEHYKTFSVSRKPVPISKTRADYLRAAEVTPSAGRTHVVDIRPMSTQSVATVFELDDCDDQITPPEQDEKWFGIGERRLTTKLAESDQEPSPAPSVKYPEPPRMKVRRVRNRQACNGMTVG